MLNLVTLFDSHYESRGRAMFKSLQKHCPAFHLYVVAFDEACEQRLRALNESTMTVIGLREFESPALLSVKKERTAGEYCWTATGFTIGYCLETFHLDHCIYVDADLLFYDDPTVLWAEVPETDSVLITAHRYSEYCDQTAGRGKYCVQFLGFKNTPDGLKVLHDWQQKCLAWCYAILDVENERFGDQKYLDKWPQNFVGVHELQHEGGGVAPWNCDQYRLSRGSRGRYTLMNLQTGEPWPLIFYHFHGMTQIERFPIGYRVPACFSNLYSSYAHKIMPYTLAKTLNKKYRSNERRVWLRNTWVWRVLRRIKRLVKKQPV